MNGGKFTEACARILEQELTGTYTPLGTPIRNMALLLRGFESQPATHNESIRVHIPRVLLSIYNIRNRRGVGHLGGDVNANVADSTLIISNADWILAELYRIFYSTSLEEAQKIVNELVSRKLILVHKIGQTYRVLATFLSFKEQTLLLLMTSYPNPVTDKELIEHLEYSNPSMFKTRILLPLHKERKIEFSKNGEALILPPGVKFIESNYQKWLEKQNNGD